MNQSKLVRVKSPKTRQDNQVNFEGLSEEPKDDRARQARQKKGARPVVLLKVMSQMGRTSFS